MSEKLNLKTRLIITIVVTFLISSHLVWDHFNGGVPTHYLFQSGDLPGFSNWLGLIFLPLLTWIVLFRINKRFKNDQSIVENPNLQNVIYRFIAAVIFGIVLSYFFIIETSIPEYMMMGLFILAFFIPLYYGEYLLGYVIGTSFTIGVMIPLMFGIVLIMIYALLYKIPRIILDYLKSKMK